MPQPLRRMLLPSAGCGPTAHLRSTGRPWSRTCTDRRKGIGSGSALGLRQLLGAELRLLRNRRATEGTRVVFEDGSRGSRLLSLGSPPVAVRHSLGRQGVIVIGL